MSFRSEFRLLQKAVRRNFDYYRRGLLCLANRTLGRESIPRTNLLFVITSGICNLSCRFCHYSKKEDGKVISETERFADYIE
jgi:sulfatase maturation enzyme AslB (radical SAM superfamily)